MVINYGISYNKLIMADTATLTVQKIAIVEDNIDLAEIDRTRLSVLGYECMTVYDGDTAISLIQQEQPNLVLLDLMVPGKSGDQILAIMRANEWGKSIPVYIISNLSQSEAPAGLRDLGIEGYAVKANLSNDQLDQLVNASLKPINSNDITLQNNNPWQYFIDSLVMWS